MRPHAILQPALTRFDRSAVMREAHRQYAQMARFGWSWSRCLKFSWAKAKARAA